MKLFDLAPQYNLTQRFGYLAQSVARRAENLNLPKATHVTSDCIIHVDRRTGQTRAYLLPMFSNRMYTDRVATAALLHGEDVYSVTTKKATAVTPWFDRITPVGLAALGETLSFNAAAGTGANGNPAANFDAAQPSWGASRFTSRLRAFGMAGSWGLPYLRLIASNKLVFYRNGAQCSLPLLVISEPIGDDFYILFGGWYTNDPVDNNVPRNTRFAGLSIRMSELEKCVVDANGSMWVLLDAASVKYFGDFSGQFASGFMGGANILSGGFGYSSSTTVSIVDLDGLGTGATAKATVSGGKITGVTITNYGDGNYSRAVALVNDSTGTGAVILLLGSDDTTGPMFSGVSVATTLPENGTFPKDAFFSGFETQPYIWGNSSGEYPPGTELWMVYQPDGVVDPVFNKFGVSFFGRSPYASPLFIRKGQMLADLRSSWDYEFKATKVSTAGDVLVEDIPFPSVGDSTDSTSNDGFNTDYFSSGWTSDYVFFDGEKFKKIGSISRGASSFVHGTPNIETDTDLVIRSCLPHVEGVDTTLDTSFYWYFPGFDFLISPPDGRTTVSNMVVEGSAFDTATYTYTATGLAVKTDGASAPLTGYIMPTMTSAFPSSSAMLGWGTYDFGASSGHHETGFSLVGFTGLLNHAVTKSVSAPTNGVAWYRGDGSIGIFVYSLNSGVDENVWEADRSKYRDIYYGNIKVTDATYEAPEVVLTRIMASITVQKNNFVSPALVPFLGTLGIPQVIL